MVAANNKNNCNMFYLEGATGLILNNYLVSNSYPYVLNDTKKSGYQVFTDKYNNIKTDFVALKIGKLNTIKFHIPLPRRKHWS